MPSKPHTTKQRAFCHALLELNEGRPRGWWASIDSVARRMGIDPDKATRLALECERAGLVRHDLSQSTKGQPGDWLPHSVILAEGGWLLPTRKRRAKKARDVS